MRNITISLILSLVVSTVATQSSQAQITLTKPSNQYPGATGTITLSDYAYTYRSPIVAGVEMQNNIQLYNVTNIYPDVEFGYKNGTRPPMKYKNEVFFSDSNPKSPREILSMVDGLFTRQQKIALKGHSMTIEIRIDPSTGKIADVYFLFLRNEPFMNIPVDTYRSIELALKHNFSVTVTAEGRKLNYLQLIWFQEF